MPVAELCAESAAVDDDTMERQAAMSCQPSARLGVGRPAYSVAQLVRLMF